MSKKNKKLLKDFEIRLTQDMSGMYEGFIVVKATSKEEALKKVKEKDKEKLDNEISWQHTDFYEGNYKTIEVDESSIKEI